MSTVLIMVLGSEGNEQVHGSALPTHIVEISTLALDGWHHRARSARETRYLGLCNRWTSLLLLEYELMTLQDQLGMWFREISTYFSFVLTNYYLLPTTII
jgi:hypothetical protein